MALKRLEQTVGQKLIDRRPDEGIPYP
ncbi:hypothetical protein [Pararhizobium sp. O133]